MECMALQPGPGKESIHTDLKFVRKSINFPEDRWEKVTLSVG